MTKIHLSRFRFPVALVTSALCAGSFLLPLSGADSQDPQRRAGAAASSPAGEPEPSLENRMKGINRNLRTVKGFLRDPKGDAPLELLKSMITHAVAARDQIPELAADQPEAARPKFLLEYRQGMRDMIVHLLDLELLVLAKDYEKASKIVDLMESHKKDSHDRFKK